MPHPMCCCQATPRGCFWKPLTSLTHRNHWITESYHKCHHHYSNQGTCNLHCYCIHVVAIMTHWRAWHTRLTITSDLRHNTSWLAGRYYLWDTIGSFHRVLEQLEPKSTSLLVEITSGTSTVILASQLIKLPSQSITSSLPVKMTDLVIFSVFCNLHLSLHCSFFYVTIIILGAAG